MDTSERIDIRPGGGPAETVFDRRYLPMVLAELHRNAPVGERIEIQVVHGDSSLALVVEGAGFTVDQIEEIGGQKPTMKMIAVRSLSLPDTVGRGMEMLICGLNPSVYAAETGVGFGRPGNRFWPAALAAGLVTKDRDPHHAFEVDRIGMTDLVKRATRRADELTTDDYRAGMSRLEWLCSSLHPDKVCMVGLAGWRAAVHRKAVAGWQPKTLGPSPVYVMPSTSGLNASSTLDDLTEHIRQAMTGPKNS